MKLVLLAYQKNKKGSNKIERLKSVLPEECTLLESDVKQADLHLLRSIASAVVLVDISQPELLSWAEEAHRWKPGLTYVGIGGEKNDLRFLPSFFYDFIFNNASPLEIKNILHRALERAEMLMKLEGLKKGELKEEKTVNCLNLFPSRRREHLLCEFSRALSNNFNRDRLLELFLNTVMELVPVGKVSVLLAEEGSGEYRIAAQRGLEPALCAKLVFRPAGALVSWLVQEGRILRMGEQDAFRGDLLAEAIQEMQLLHAVICVPMMAHGLMAGVLNLGPKVTGAVFSQDELEMLFILSCNVAAALKDIEMHHRLCHQKLYIENILLHMRSGVIAIDRNESVTTFNSRASEILSLNPEDVLGKDLRCLPSPLGDLLYETLSTGRAYHQEEVELALGNIPLEVSTYRLVPEGGKIMGSVMVFDDLSERKELERERRKSDQLSVLNRFVSQLAHEIKNPMVAIQTFAELLQEKYDDSSFRDFFSRTVRQEIIRLNELIEQLIAFSSPLSYKDEVVDIHEVVDAALLLLRERGSGENIEVVFSYCDKPLPVRVDKELMARAFSYLLLNSFRLFEKGGKLKIKSEEKEGLPQGAAACLSFRDFETKIGKEDLEAMFDPLFRAEESPISLGLPVSKKIIEDHKGRVKASLTRDGFLTLEVMLPVCPLHERSGAING